MEKILLNKRKIIIPQYYSIENDISQYEKEINYEKLFLEKNNLKESEPHFLNKKVKRSVNENDDDNSSLEIKKKNDNMDFEYISDSNLEGNDKNEREKNDSNNSDYLDNEKIFEESYKRIIEKYGFKEDGQLLKNIFAKMQDESIEGNEIDDLHFVYNYMNNISKASSMINIRI